RVVIIDFTQAGSSEEPEPPLTKAKLKKLVKQRNPKVTDEDFEDLIAGMNAKFRKLLSDETLSLALDMYFRAQTRDNCQYEVLYNENWDKEQTPSMEITLAWRNTPKHHFLYRLLRTIHRNNLVMKWVNATYINPYSKNSVLVMVIALHGSRGQAAWDAADIRTFLRELATVKYFASFDLIDQELVNTGVITGIMGNFLRAMVNFVHQVLVHIDPFLYTIENIEEALTRHPELTSQICQAFEKKFDPAYVDLEAYHHLRQKFIRTVEKLDTGQEVNDTRRKNVLFQGMNLVHYCLKTNFFRTNFTSISFRLDPHYLDDVPFDRTEKFPKLPYAVFFIKGMHFFGFHIRFKDLARGGIRTVYPRQVEHTTWERNHVFTECYNLAFTQQKKNKDIPEGGAKGVIFLRPWDRLESETAILHKEFEESSLSRHEIDKRLENFQNEQQLEYMHHAQRSFIESLLPIVNCEPDGKIRTKYVIDYWERPEYLYLGPDENMHDEIIQWIAEQAIKYDYKPGGAFISSKPKAGMNHKEFGVTSLGVNVYMHETLKFLGIDPLKKVFTVKISGGPDGDVAGNQILNLQKYYPKTAKVLAITDVSGTIFDPKGLDLDLLKQLVKKGQPIRFYPPEELNQGGFLLDLTRKTSSGSLSQQTLCWRKKKGGVTKEWLSGSDMNHLFRTNVHQTKTDIFIPAGGRPRTLHHSNVTDFLDEFGVPTSKAIVEGANLYLTPKARHFLEEK
ncbi:MAG: NAD-glutamate dehydrogenase, partial [Chlamydiia bacterium]|nr:NAD-glutamate dehydrogenase [Chlamydiia bacterium]